MAESADVYGDFVFLFISGEKRKVGRIEKIKKKEKKEKESPTPGNLC